MAGLSRSVVAGLLLLLAGCGGAHGGSPFSRVAITGTPSRAVIDEPMRVTISGLAAGQTATLTARWQDLHGISWGSRQSVRAPRHGPLVLGGVDGMRFIWSMRPSRGHPEFFLPPRGASTIRLTISDGGRVLARASLRLHPRAPGVRGHVLTLSREHLDGAFYTPARRRGRGIAVVVIGGSQGGTPTDTAVAYANHGYQALALCYFKCPGLPRRLERIPLEYFARGLRWLARRPGVDAHRIIIDGGSRGGEGALLIASTYPHLVHGAIALSPNYQVYPACCDRRSYEAVHPPAAWTLHGRPVEPFNPIAVERISGPVLLEGGGQDHVWRSSYSTQQIDQRLTDHHFRYPHVRLDFPRAGHIVSGPQWPSSDTTHFGGSPRANALAGAALTRAWVRYLRALDAGRGL